MEMLHALLLGIFKYIRDCFFDQIGPTSTTSDEINALAQEYGDLLQRQSDRDFPKTKFAGGITRGKLMAKEYPGILVCMAAVLRSTKGRNMLLGAYTSNFRKKGVLKDWIMLVEIMLQWEMWLKSDKMMKSDVENAHTKHRYIMYLIKKVGRRSQGMGLKIIKFHGIMHMAMDIEYFGVPMEVDTGTNEQGHKPAKTAAKLTQKKAELFDEQTEKRLEEVELLALGEEEIAGRPLFDYPKGYHHTDPIERDHGQPRLGGAKYYCHYDAHKQKNTARLMVQRKGDDDVRMETGLINFVVGLQNSVQQYQDRVYLETTHFRNGAIFRGNAAYSGTVWRDWALVDWDDDGILPNKIWGFVDLSALSQNSGINYGGVSNVQPGLYAIVESAVYTKTQAEVDMSELFVPIRKEVLPLRNGFVSGMKFYLADVEAIVETARVIPDIGGPANAYFLVRPRSMWSVMFTEWLGYPHEDDEMDSEIELENDDSDEDSDES